MAVANHTASTDVIILRVCRTCSIEQPISNFYFTRQYPWKDCKACEAVKSAAKRNANPEEFRAKARARDAKRRLNSETLTQEELKKWVSYDMQTGLFTRIKFLGNCHPEDDVGGLNDDGYLVLRVAGIKYLAHKLAWLYVYGEFPISELDHMNNNRADNRICNLRNATRSGNVQNVIRPRRNNKSGYLGVSLREDGRWRATISVDGKKVSLGSFDDPSEAHQAYLEAKRTYHTYCTI